MLDYLQTPARQARTLSETSHRPWPVPTRSWIQGQTWEHLLFAHWRVDREQLQAIVPPQLPVDTFDDSAWLGITPFRVSGFRLRGTLPLPVMSSFLELNVRTYVTVEDKPGIYFFSLDCANPLAVEAARRTYRLPYYRANMSAMRRGGWIDYASARREGASRPHQFIARYRPAGEVSPAQPDTLEHFVSERYCLYTLDERQDIARAEIHHPPWPLQSAEAEIERNTMAPEGADVGGEPLLHYAERQDVVIWPLERVQPEAASSEPAPRT